MDLEILKEKTIHGTNSFPFTIYFDEFLNKTNDNLYMHWHKEIEIIYVYMGEATFYINTEAFKVQTGDIVFINSEFLHCASITHKNLCKYHAIVFNLEMLTSSLFDVCDNDFIYPLITKDILFPTIINSSFKDYKALLKNITDILKFWQNKITSWQLFTKSNLLNILGILALNQSFISNKYNEDSTTYKNEILKKVIEYIQQNYKNKIYIENLSSLANMNTQYFCRFFKSLTDKTPIEYVVCYRIEQACILLKNSNKRILDIALETGFDNFSYFIKKFKELKGYTPSKYRNLLEENMNESLTEA